jgi:hypothetical protein
MGQRGGFCDYRAKRIVIQDRQAPNAKVRVAIHELAHALGVSSERFGRERAEVIVECAAFVVAAGLQLETGGESIPYVAGWGEDGALNAVAEAAGLIDEIARMPGGADRRSCPGIILLGRYPQPTTQGLCRSSSRSSRDRASEICVLKRSYIS